MSQVGIRELKQNASEVVARAESGEVIDITLRGRPVARISPLRPAKQQWVAAEDLGAALDAVGPDDSGWLDEHHRSRDDDPIVDPWIDK